MRLLMWMQPRSRPAAVRTLVTLAGVAALITVAFLPIQPGRRDPTAVEAALTLVAAGLVIAACWMARSRRTPSLVAWALGPLAAVAAIVGVDLITADASVAAQIFFFFPTLYGASQLPRAGAIVMTAASLVGESIVVISLLPVREAVIDIGYVTAALVTTAVILIRSGERQAELIDTLRRQAAIDTLTGLATRRVLDEAAQSAISGSHSVEGTSLILLDVDAFKSINDRYGHPGGDEVLVQLADLLVKSARHDDVVCRIGGDEMALLLPGCSVSSLRRRAHQIVDDVRAREFVLADGQSLTVSVSVGLAHAPTDAVDLRTLYVKADQTLYDAKRSGRNRVGIVADGTASLLSTGVEGIKTFAAAPPAGTRQVEAAEMERMIRRAVDHDGVRVDYQPIVDLSTGLLVAVEALLRLTDDDGSLLPAGEVIPAAEASGLIVDVGRRVIQVAVLQSSRWRAEHGVILPIAVNVSAAEVSLPGFSHDVLEVIERAGVPAEALRVELTESVLLESGSGGMEQLRELSEAGVELGIDDFGTGYASLSLLHSLRACTIKIDQSFVSGIPDDSRAVAIVTGVIAMAKSLDMTCIAEGIETERQRNYLAERGVLGQGYLLGRPDGAAAIGRLITGNRLAPSISTVAPPS